jgi:AcrR family transcriptional regulator
MMPSTRERLLAAAETVFARRGLRAATVAEIAAEAEISAGLLYRYFPGKADLAVAIIDRDRDETVAAIASLDELGDARQALTLLTEGWIDAGLSDRAACALIGDIAAEAGRDGVIAAAAAAHEAAVVGAVSALVMRAGRSDIDASAVAVLLVSALDGLIMRVGGSNEFDPAPSTRALLAALPILLGDSM